MKRITQRSIMKEGSARCADIRECATDNTPRTWPISSRILTSRRSLVPMARGIYVLAQSVFEVEKSAGIDVESWIGIN